MDLGLQGLNAIVTGGTRGIGRAIADTLADEGANVAICARHADDVVECRRRAAGEGRPGHRAGPRRRRRPRAAGMGTSRRRRARRDRHRRLQRVGAGHRWRRGLLEERVPDRHDGRGASGRRGHAEPGELRRRRPSSPSPASRAARSTSRPAPTGRSRRRSSTTPRVSPTTWPARGSGPTRSRRATPTSPEASGPRSRPATPSCSPPHSASTPPGAWARHKRWPTPSPSSPAHEPASSPAPTSSSTVPSPRASSSDLAAPAVGDRRPAGTTRRFDRRCARGSSRRDRCDGRTHR